MTWFYISVGKAYYTQMKDSDICVDIILKDDLGLNPFTLKCMGFLGLWKYLHGFNQENYSFDGFIFEAEDGSGDQDEINAFLGDFNHVHHAVLDVTDYLSLSQNILLYDASTMNPTHGSEVVQISIFNELYQFLLNYGFCSEIYQNLLSGENEYIHSLLIFLLSKIEEGLTQFDYQWIIEFDQQHGQATPVVKEELPKIVVKPVSKEMPSAYTQEEMLEMFIDAVDGVVEYWANTNGSDKNKCEGVAFSIMNIIDGTSGAFPCSIDLRLAPHPDNKEYRISQNESFVEDGMIMNSDCLIHERFNR